MQNVKIVDLLGEILQFVCDLATVAQIIHSLDYFVTLGEML